MNTKTLITCLSIIIFLTLMMTVNYFKPKQNNSFTTQDFNPRTPVTSLAANPSVNLGDKQHTNPTSLADHPEFSKTQVTHNRQQSIDDLQLFFESNPQNEHLIVSHLNQAIPLSPIELSLNIIPYINHPNPKIQVLALGALYSAMQRTEQESEDPSFVDHRNEDLRKNIGVDINLQLKNNPNPELFNNIIAVYDRTNPSLADTEKMITWIYQKNQYKTPTDMELDYIKTSFKHYPELQTSSLKSAQYSQINTKISD